MCQVLNQMLHHKNLSTCRNTVVQVDQILIEQPNASGRHVRADGPGLDGAMNAVEQVAAIAIEIESSRSHRIVWSTLHRPSRSIGITLDHLGWRRPGGPH